MNRGAVVRRFYFNFPVLILFVFVGCAYNKPDSVLGYWLRVDNPYYTVQFDESNYTLRKKADSSKGDTGKDIIKKGLYFQQGEKAFILEAKDKQGLPLKINMQLRGTGLYIGEKRFEKIKSLGDQQRYIKHYNHKNL